MTKHSRVIRRITGFGAVGAAAGFAPSTSQAEVIFTPLDVNIPSEVGDYHVDLNIDGISEFDIQHFDTVTKVGDFTTTTSVVLDPIDNRTANLADLTLIGPESFWSTPGTSPSPDQLNGTVEEPAESGNFVPTGHFQVSDGPGYIGVRFDIAGSSHYGYVGYEGTGAENAAEGRVFALGYENVPDTAIAAGAGAPPPADADFNGDGDIDGEDLLIWQRNLGATGQSNNDNGDADGNGAVDGADLEAWTAQFEPGGPPVSAIPEPSSLSLLAAGATGVLVYRRRRQ
jgi:hypothetical protein